MSRWQIVSDNSELFREATTCLSTIELPGILGMGIDSRDYLFESCLFFKDGESDVLARYQTQAEANEGHHRLCREHKLSNHWG